MSAGLEVLAMKEDDVTKLLAAGSHLGEPNIDYQMSQYVFKVKNDGVPIINLKKTWEKLLLAARVIAAIENPKDICVLSIRQFGQRAVLKFANYTGAQPVAGRFTPGTFTNQIQAAFKEPRLLVVTDPRADHQPVAEASYVNIPVIAFCNTNSPLRHIDIAIPSNNTSKLSIGLMWWLLAREVLRLRGSISRDLAWEVMPDLFFYRDPEEVEKDELARREAEQTTTEWAGVPPVEGGFGTTEPAAAAAAGEQWGDGDEWGTTEKPPVVVPQAAPAATGAIPAGIGAAAPTASAVTAPFSEQWDVPQPTKTTSDWGADDGTEWGTAEPKATAGSW